MPKKDRSIKGESQMPDQFGKQASLQGYEWVVKHGGELSDTYKGFTAFDSTKLRSWSMIAIVKCPKEERTWLIEGKMAISELYRFYKDGGTPAEQLDIWTFQVNGHYPIKKGEMPYVP